MNVSAPSLGIIGSAWANNLIADGHNSAVLEPDPKGFPQSFRASIQEAVSQADVIIVIVADPPAVHSVRKADPIQTRPGTTGDPVEHNLRKVDAPVCRAGAGKPARRFWRPHLRGVKLQRNSARLFIFWAATPK